MIKKHLKFLILLSLISFQGVSSSENNIYNKIDLFGEVLEKINKEYVDEINQSESMDSAINGLLQSLDPYSAYMSPEIFNEMQTETSGEFGGLGIEVSMESGVVKVISPIDDTPASRAGIKAGDYIVKINDIQVQGKSLSEAVDLMRGPVGSAIELTIRRIGEKKAITFNITREIIQIQSVKADLLEENIHICSLFVMDLLTHILLSIVLIPMVLISYVRAIQKEFDPHKKIAKLTFPVWLYVTITGVIVFIMISPYY